MNDSRFAPLVSALLFVALLGLVALLPACGGLHVSTSGSASTGASSGQRCTGPADSGLVIVVSVHRNVPAPALPSVARCPLEQNIGAHRPIAVIALDGLPRVVLAPTVLDVTDANAAAHDDDIAAATSQVLAVVHKATAAANGDDLLSAMGLVADTARAAGLAHPRIMVLDSGLTDTGIIQLATPTMVAARPQDVASYVARYHELPDLRDARVDLVGFGYASAPQHPLTTAQRAAVTAIWREVFARAGAAVSVEPVARSGAGPTTRYTTRTVDFSPPRPFRPAPDKTYVFDDSSPLAFEVDSSSLRDEGAGIQTLKPLALWLSGAAGRHANLLGTTDSTGSTAHNQVLSRARAAAIKRLLVSLGAPAGSISTDGAGYVAAPPDVDAGGVIDPAKAAQNRSVRVTLTGPR